MRTGKGRTIEEIDNRMLTERAFYCFPLFFCANSLAVCGSMTISTNRRRTVAASALGDFSIYYASSGTAPKTALRYKNPVYPS